MRHVQHGYILGVGTNIEPERNAPLIVEQLIDKFGGILISRFYETAPVGMQSDQSFINFCAFVETALDVDACKAVCIDIEINLGRDRAHPYRKTRDRAADIDLLARLCAGGRQVQLQAIAEYLAQPAAEVASFLSAGRAIPVVRGHVRTFTIGDLQLGHTPTAIDRDDRTGLVVIR